MYRKSLEADIERLTEENERLKEHLKLKNKQEWKRIRALFRGVTRQSIVRAVVGVGFAVALGALIVMTGLAFRDSVDTHYVVVIYDKHGVPQSCDVFEKKYKIAYRTFLRADGSRLYLKRSDVFLEVDGNNSIADRIDELRVGHLCKGYNDDTGSD